MTDIGTPLTPEEEAEVRELVQIGATIDPNVIGDLLATLDNARAKRVDVDPDLRARIEAALADYDEGGCFDNGGYCGKHRGEPWVCTVTERALAEALLATLSHERRERLDLPVDEIAAADVPFDDPVALAWVQRLHRSHREYEQALVERAERAERRERVDPDPETGRMALALRSLGLTDEQVRRVRTDEGDWLANTTPRERVDPDLRAAIEELRPLADRYHKATIAHEEDRALTELVEAVDAILAATETPHEPCNHYVWGNPENTAVINGVCALCEQPIAATPDHTEAQEGKE
jgi:hypothetical protein